MNSSPPLTPGYLGDSVGICMALHMNPAGIRMSVRKRGVEFKGGGLHDGFGGFDGFGGSGEHLALLSLVLQITVPKRQP